MPKAYWVNTYRSVKNPDALAAYAKLALPALVAAGGRVLARGMPEKVYERGLEQRVVIFEFDSVEQATAAHDSPGYQEALRALGDGAERDLRIVPGVEPAAVQLLPVTTATQLAAVAGMAREIWYEYYVPLIGRAQVDYMVSRFQTAEAMQAQIDTGYEYFLVQQSGGNIGYAAIRFDAGDGRLFISKLYLLAAHRKSGAGRQALTQIERLARERGAKLLWLTVNKGNPSVRAYERLGFHIAEAIVMDIGGGFVMDDYRMEKPLEA